MGSWTLVAENALRVRDAANKVQKARELCREASRTLMSVAQCIDDTDTQQFTDISFRRGSPEALALGGNAPL